MNKLIHQFNIITILGPTATGKTQLSVQLAHKLGGEIISADSRQVYRGMDIGTGKDLNEYNFKDVSIPYHLIDIVAPMEEYNVAQFQRDFQRVYSDITKRKKLPILCGGTGFYIKAVLMDFQLPKTEPDKQLRQKLENWELEDLINELETISPGASVNTPVDTKRRVIRAIEVAKSRDREKETGKRGAENSNLQDTTVIGIEYPREVIRERITKRLHSRLNSGMIEEVEALLIGGVTHHRLDTLGLEYRFISRFLKGDYSKEKMTGLLNTAIHQFAKKQMTFFRNMENNGIKIHWIPEGNFETALGVILKDVIL
ncbi:MAG: tRNA (adenosine(37)-N6)-dimethylallyltransferase MiaA [Candidatus Marinimicrobia bacterium]|nr:tRNA (adenosine(37)-N6)-dimethylallyltransferase MiaA [Candidatus Neomarinimicrobiota bacterium]